MLVFRRVEYVLNSTRVCIYIIIIFATVFILIGSLSKYTWQPASKEYVTEIFHLLDTDDSGTLGKEEFAEVIKILFSQVFTRIVIHWCLALMSK